MPSLTARGKRCSCLDVQPFFPRKNIEASPLCPCHPSHKSVDGSFRCHIPHTIHSRSSEPIIPHQAARGGSGSGRGGWTCSEEAAWSASDSIRFFDANNSRKGQVSDHPNTHLASDTSNPPHLGRGALAKENSGSTRLAFVIPLLAETPSSTVAFLDIHSQEAKLTRPHSDRNMQEGPIYAVYHAPVGITTRWLPPLPSPQRMILMHPLPQHYHPHASVHGTPHPSWAHAHQATPPHAWAPFSRLGAAEQVWTGAWRAEGA